MSASVIDLRTLWPWDRDTVLADCARTGRLLVVHEAVQVAGFGAEVAATAAQATGCRVARLGAPRIPVGFAPQLEAVVRIQPAGHCPGGDGHVRACVRSDACEESICVPTDRSG